MEIAELIELINKTLNLFDTNIDSIITDIKNSTKTEISTTNLINKKQFKDAFQYHLLQFTFGPEFAHQLEITSPEIEQGKSLLDLFFQSADRIRHALIDFDDKYTPVIMNYLHRKPLFLFSLYDKFSEFPEYLEIKTTLVEEYEEFLSNLQSTTIPPKDQADQILKTLLNLLVIKHAQGKLTEKLKIRYAEAFINELFGQPLKVFYFASLSGLSLHQDVFLNKNFSLVTINEKDIEIINEFGIFPIEKVPTFPTSSVLKIVSKLVDPLELFEIEERLLQILRLFKLNEVNISYRAYYFESVIRYYDIKLESIPHKKPDITLDLQLDEENVLIDFAKTMLHIFRNQLKKESCIALQNALERFNWALTDYLRIDRRLMFAVMGLEPIFSRDQERGEHSYKLSIRIPKLFEQLGFNTDTVREDIEKSYTFRNMVVHGRKYTPANWEKQMQNLLPRMLNYLRISLIVFLLNTKIGKDDLVEIIDSSITNKQQGEKLKKIIAKDIDRFAVCFHDTSS